MSSALPAPDEGETTLRETADLEKLHQAGVRQIIWYLEPDYAADALDAFGLRLLRDLCQLYRKTKKEGSAFKAHRDGCYQGALGVFAQLYPFDSDVLDTLQVSPARYVVDAARWERIIERVSQRPAWRDD